MSSIAALRLGNPVERLARVLKENQDKLNLSKDGFVSVDLSNDKAMKAIKDQMDKLESIKTNAVKEKNYNRAR
ncbi:multidrug ABC transporter ATPase [Lonsdalea populi]|uniref:multidrug ABC transporter ATPase n=1 Tax=Lonsdalea populi TaxID=1172565 RepID=UPI000A1FD589|nr:multidrug ABC transporter ATPase [Lonsdalea populi]OSM94659.1 multidrug ABC transporter ATPase [Lonsdalea populi]QPQ23751.1 multidrug ABC transporter ATPase [Lonsdalea populi]RAT40479.1 multidrug ABC transporter ATPase [Lonsdalea populi]RAT41312.1 multidrug ABC transporter ATPase [Lonsdalea populi]RAT52491.1 multidrug ABC transporter ATPase [Lonsdalea populi]